MAYSSLEVATITGTTRKTIENHIREGFLKATKEGRCYQISISDLNDYLKNQTDRNNISSGKKKIFTKEEYERLTKFFITIQKAPTIEEIIKTFEREAFVIPFLEVYERFKRDESIRSDKQKGFKNKKLAEKYNLSESSIENIVKKEVSSESTII